MLVSGYTVGDVLTFPDVQGKNISSAPSTGAGGISLRVVTTSFGSLTDGAAYPHQSSLHDVLPVDTQVDNNNTLRILRFQTLLRPQIHLIMIQILQNIHILSITQLDLPIMK